MLGASWRGSCATTTTYYYLLHCTRKPAVTDAVSYWQKVSNAQLLGLALLRCIDCSLFTARCTLVQSAVLRSHVVRLSVCPSLCPSVTLVSCDHIGWNSSKIISPLVSLGRSLFAAPIWRVSSKWNIPKFGPKVAHPLLIWALESFDCKLRPNGYA